ncbi:MAG: hypothetical protein Q9225_001640 [Loekoesia sp. 1 TL-2023]
MVLLSMTGAIVNAINSLRRLDIGKSELDPDGLGPDLENPAIGHPIAHVQVVALSRLLRRFHNSIDDAGTSCHLDDLLRGSRIYYEPPKPKAEPSNEYKILMARLRYEEEARIYERMVNPPLPMETFEQRFPNSSNAKLFSGNQAQVDEDDDVTYADVNRQMALIVNILVSIVACSVALWLVASRWSTPSRLALSMGGSVLVAVAEAVVYTGYLRRVKEARESGKKQVEIKEIVKTWVIGDDEKPSQLGQPSEIILTKPIHDQVRRRNVKPG